MRGVNIERKIVAQLRNEGWLCARSAGSKSPIDVWAVKEGSVRLIQVKRVKRNSFKIKETMNELRKLKEEHGCKNIIVELHIWHERVGFEILKV